MTRKPISAGAARCALLALLAAAAGCSDSTAVGRTVKVVVTTSRSALNALSDTVVLHADVRDGSGGLVLDPTVVWNTPDTVLQLLPGDSVRTQAVSRASGTAHVIATADGIADTVTITVQQVPASIVVTSSRDSLFAFNESVPVTAVVTDSNGVPVVDAAPSWSADPSNILSLADSGLTTTITSLENGPVYVAATVGSVADSALVIVRQRLRYVRIRPKRDTSFTLGDTITFVAQVTDRHGFPVSFATVNWSLPAGGTLRADSLTARVVPSTVGIIRLFASTSWDVDTATLDSRDVTAKVVITPGTPTLVVGDTIAFDAFRYDSAGVLQAGAPATMSLDTLVLRQRGTTRVYDALAAGVARVVAKANSGSADTATVTVTP